MMIGAEWTASKDVQADSQTKVFLASGIGLMRAY